MVYVQFFPLPRLAASGGPVTSTAIAAQGENQKLLIFLVLSFPPGRFPGFLLIFPRVVGTQGLHPSEEVEMQFFLVF